MAAVLLSLHCGMFERQLNTVLLTGLHKLKRMQFITSPMRILGSEMCPHLGNP